MRSKVKIAVVKLLTAHDVYGEPLPATPDESVLQPCPRFKEGDQFIVPEDGSCPPGFCGWAYADIQRDITHLRLGGDFPWVKEKGGWPWPAAPTPLDQCSSAWRGWPRSR